MRHLAGRVGGCLRRHFGSDNPPERANLEFLIELRNKIEHRQVPESDPGLYGECQAALLNLETLLSAEFRARYALSDLPSPVYQRQRWGNLARYLNRRHVYYLWLRTEPIAELVRNSKSPDQLGRPRVAQGSVAAERLDQRRHVGRPEASDFIIAAGRQV
jgi:hypothetical protein